MKETLQAFLTHIANLDGESRALVFKRPATESEVENVEIDLKYRLPADFRNALLTISSHCDFHWQLPDELALPEELRQIFRGELHWGLDLIIPFNLDKDNWIKVVFPNIEDEYDKVWHNKFALQKVPNGDYIAIDLEKDTYGNIVYLSHDDGEGHGYVMANSFTELLTNWTQIGCVGGEDWQWLPFADTETSGIDPDSDNAKLWKKTIGLI